MSGNMTQQSPEARAAAADGALGQAAPSPVAAFLLKLVKAMKGAQFYPVKHPAFAALLENCHEAAGSLFTEHGALAFEAKNQKIFFGGKPVAPELPETRTLAMECVYRRVRRFQIGEGTNADELEGFIRTFVTGPEQIQAAGGIEKLLFENEVRHVSVNEVNYQDLLYGEAPEDNGEDFFAQQGEGGEEGAPEEDPLALPEDATILQEQLIKLLTGLDAATDVREYGEGASTLVSLISTAEPPFETEDHYRALRVLSDHAAGREGRDQSIVPHALWAIREIATPKIIAFLVQRLMSTPTAMAPRLFDLLAQIGSGAIPLLIDQLGTAKSIHARRILSTAVSSFGDAAVPYLLSTLNDPRWYVLRNATAILGEIGDPETVSSLEPLASYPDLRISKEALRALGKIRSPESRKTLELFLVHARGERQLLAAFALGVLRDADSVPCLAAMLPRRVIFTSLDLQREVIKALAKIGSPAAVPALGRILRRRSLLARDRNESLRLSAAQALARINTEEARAFLLRGVDSANEKVAKICRTALYNEGK